MAKKTAKYLNSVIEKELLYYFQRMRKGMRVRLRHFPEVGEGTVVSAMIPGTILVHFDCKEKPTHHNKIYLEKIL